MNPTDIGPPDVYQLVSERTAKTQMMIIDLTWWAKLVLIALVALVIVEITKLIIQTIISIRQLQLMRKTNKLLTVTAAHAETTDRNKERIDKAAAKVEKTVEEVKAASATAAEVAKAFEEEIKHRMNGGHGSVEMHGPKSSGVTKDGEPKQ